jgi:hypothetical protein
MACAPQPASARAGHHGHTGTMRPVRVRQADSARATHAAGTDARRACALDATASRLLGLELRRGWSFPRRHSRPVRLTGPSGHGAPDMPGAWGSRRAITAIAASPRACHDVVIADSNRRGPAAARVSCGAGHLRPISVEHHAAEVTGAFHMGWPAPAASHGTAEVDGRVALADREPCGIDPPRIDDRAPRQEALGFQGRMHGRGGLTGIDWRRGGQHVSGVGRHVPLQVCEG